MQLNSIDLAFAFSTVEGEDGCQRRRSLANLGGEGRDGGAEERGEGKGEETRGGGRGRERRRGEEERHV